MAKITLDFMPNAVEKPTPLAPVKLGCNVQQRIAEAAAEAVRLEGLGLSEQEQAECVSTALGLAECRWQQLGYRLTTEGDRLVPIEPVRIFPYAEQVRALEDVARRVIDEASQNAVGHCRSLGLYKRQQQQRAAQRIVCPHCHQ
jgi:hypothetical protein